MEHLLTWDVYEITTESTSLIGVSMRGSLRKHAVAAGINLLVENATDKENCVRFAILSGREHITLQSFLLKKAPTATITCVLVGVANPVLSKLSIVTSEAKY